MDEMDLDKVCLHIVLNFIMFVIATCCVGWESELCRVCAQVESQLTIFQTKSTLKDMYKTTHFINILLFIHHIILLIIKTKGLQRGAGL